MTKTPPQPTIISAIAFYLFMAIFCLAGDKLNAQESALGCNAAIIRSGGEICFARNLDIQFSDGFWITNQRGGSRKAYIPYDCGDKQAKWKAKYGSLTINAYHIDIPLGGMNEAGLVVEHLACQSKFPPADGRAAITPQQWIQYQLDRFSTIDEVIASDDSLRIAGWIFEYVHFLVCDRFGNVAVIEYLNNDGASEKRVYTGKDVPRFMSALGNAPYQEHIDFMKQYANFGGSKPVPQSKDTLRNSTKYQFAFSAENIRQFETNPGKDVVGYSFDILEGLRWNSTHLSIVYDIANMKIHFVTSKNRDRRTLDFNDFDFSGKGPRHALLWHNSVDPENWIVNIDHVNDIMVDYYAGVNGHFEPYKEELLIYRADADASSVQSDLSEFGKFSAFPNPATDLVTIDFGDSDGISGPFEIKIYNVLGECVKVFKTISSEPVRINVSDLVPGFYFAKYRNDLSPILKKW